MNDDDLALRNLTYARLVELGRAPTAAEIAAVGGRGRAEVMAGWERLHAEHALVLDMATGEIRMAHPFSGVPTAYRVQAAGQWWYGNCTRTGGSRLLARTAVNRCGSRSAISDPMTKACSFTA